LITGASRGIGAATARLAAAHGYFVVVNFLGNTGRADEVVDAILRDGGTAHAIQADISSEREVERLFSEAHDRFGRLDALVNNAGITAPRTRVENIDAERIARLFATNVTGTLLCAREAIRRMSTANGGNGGVIVNVSSRAAVLGGPNEYVDYAASKGAIDTFTVGLAKEVALVGIRVNAVRPGLVHTEIHATTGEPGRVDRLAPIVPLARGGQPEEIASAILWLMSDEASYSTGTILDVSGGL
jgi:NAD(P)-dependent dehydrogenase (short-subunit alcohol dehydrogenase family)